MAKIVKPSMKRTCAACGDVAYVKRTRILTEIVGTRLVPVHEDEPQKLGCCRDCLRVAHFKFEAGVEELRRINREARQG